MGPKQVMYELSDLPRRGKAAFDAVAPARLLGGVTMDPMGRFSWHGLSLLSIQHIVGWRRLCHPEAAFRSGVSPDSKRLKGRTPEMLGDAMDFLGRNMRTAVRTGPKHPKSPKQTCETAPGS